MQKIGVFVCWCGSNIAATVDVKKVAEVLRAEPGVVISENYLRLLSVKVEAFLLYKVKHLSQLTEVFLLNIKIDYSATLNSAICSKSERFSFTFSCALLTRVS